MKYIYYIITILVMIFNSFTYSQNSVNSLNKSLKKPVTDSLVSIDPIIPEPVVIYRPEIKTPYQFRSIKEKVKIIVNIKVDTLGNNHFVRIKYSSNKKLNNAAIKYTMQYKFEVFSENGKKKSTLIDVPIIFNN